MKFQDLANMFNRSWDALSLRKFFIMFVTLFVAGLIVIFFYGLSYEWIGWLQIAMHWGPIFIVIPLLMVSGSMLMKNKMGEEEGLNFKNRSMKASLISFRKYFTRSGYFFGFFLGIFFALWIILGLFILLKMIPYVGLFLGIILVIVPCLIHLSFFLLFIAAIGALFFFTPTLALKPQIEKKDLVKRLEADLFTHCITFASALIPVWIVWMIVTRAVHLTLEVYQFPGNAFAMFFQSIFLLIPFAAALALPLMFFFHFSLEAYLWKERNRVN